MREVEEEDADHVTGDSHWKICNKTDPDTLLRYQYERKQNTLQQQPLPSLSELADAKTKIAELQGTIRAQQTTIDGLRQRAKQAKPSVSNDEVLRRLTEQVERLEVQLANERKSREEARESAKREAIEAAKSIKDAKRQALAAEVERDIWKERAADYKKTLKEMKKE